MPKTFSCSSTKAMETETGNSIEEMMLPNPNPVLGNPALSKIGGSMVPKTAKKIPNRQKIETSNALGSANGKLIFEKTEFI